MTQSAAVKAAAKQAAQAVGFELFGVAPVADSPELAYFPRWIAAGYAGEMNYLQTRDDEGRLKRASLRRAVPWARSVVVCAINYSTEQPYSTAVHEPGRGWISRYAWGREDYHQAVMRKLRSVEQALHAAAEDTGESLTREDSGQDSGNGKDFRDGNGALQTHCYVDTGPVVERVFAKYAGVGWIGKNTCIINQKLGSWVFLGVIVTSLELEPDLPAPDRCGSCTRCIVACPTDALIAPYQLDSNECISYLTIEKRGTIPEPLHSGIGRHVFGCDICQDVCPWNRKAPATTAAEFQPRAELVNPALEWLAEMSEEEFRRVFKDSPVRRAKHPGLRRNAIIAMGNSKNPKFIKLLKRLSQDSDKLVANSARSALGAIDRNSS